MIKGGYQIITTNGQILDYQNRFKNYDLFLGITTSCHLGIKKVRKSLHFEILLICVVIKKLCNALMLSKVKYNPKFKK